MKKNIILMFTIILSLIVFMVPNKVLAEVKMTGYKETIDEEIEIYGKEKDYSDYTKILKSADLSDYKESDEKVNVYIFRGSTCAYCLKAITYFASKADEYKNYINLKTYEVWNNQDNNNLMNNVAAVFGKEVSGVPFIVIGDKTFDGYSESMNSEIESVIKNQYESHEKYDVMEHLTEKKSKSKYNNKKIFAILGVILFGIIIIIVIFKYVEKRNEKIELQKKKRLEETKKLEQKIAEGKKKNSAKKTSSKTSKTKKTTTKTGASKTSKAKKTTTKK